MPDLSPWSLTSMPAWHVAVISAYLVSVVGLSVFGLHRLSLVLLYRRHRDRELPLPEPVPDADCPDVLVQLPIFNERFVVERLLGSIAALDWPKDRLHIQLLDDSTDDTVELSQRLVRRWQREGFDVELIQRTDRTGFKAGALQAGLEAGTPWPFVAIFDADFVPPADFLRRILPPLLEDEGIGMVQARWGHLNRDDTLLTRAQAILLDGHFVMESGARFRGGRFFNFNGTAGVWRRQAIVDAGGWQGDTLTEDLDLSYRAQLEGWRFSFLQALEVPAELPSDPRAFKSQQHRWAKGSIQTAFKLLPRIWRASLPLSQKLEATFHMGNNLAYPLMVVLLLVLPVAIVLRAGSPLWIGLAVDLPVFLFATLNLMIFYALAEREVAPGAWKRRLVLVPFVLGLGASLTPNQARAVWQAVRGHRSPFVRTPKFGGHSGRSRYRPRLGVQAAIEALGCVYYLAAAGFAAHAGLWLSMPFLLLFAAGFGVLGFGSLMPDVTAATASSERPPSRATPLPAARTQARAPRSAPPKGRRSAPRSTPGRTAAGGR
jgi:cellulose synthase/poly-beta-1,6-N-acetylglucosamine synthase-like glycosyltransferase